MKNNLRTARKEFGLSQAEVAVILGMSQTGYSKYETGENDISIVKLITLSRFYGKSVDYLLGLPEEKTEE